MAAAKVPPGNAGRKRSQPAPVQVKEEVTDQLFRQWLAAKQGAVPVQLVR